MKYPQYKTDLQRIHESEVYGRAVFATAARLTRNAGRKAKWLKLHTLEEETLARYLGLHGQDWPDRGRTEGLGTEGIRRGRGAGPHALAARDAARA